MSEDRVLIFTFDHNGLVETRSEIRNKNLLNQPSQEIFYPLRILGFLYFQNSIMGKLITR